MTRVPVVDEDLFSPEALADPHPLYARLRRRGPVHLLPDLDLHLVIGHAHVLQALDDPTTFSSNLAALIAAGTDGTEVLDMSGAAVDVLATVDPPRHAPQRAAVAPAFTRRTMTALTQEVEDLLTPRVTGLAARGGGNWMAEVAGPVPVAVISRLLGLPADDADRITAWSDCAIELLSGQADADRMLHLGVEILHFMAYLDTRIRQAAEQPCGGLLDTLAREEALTPDERVAMALQLVTAGAESTAGLIGATALTLADDPALAEKLRTDPTLIEAFVEETLRLQSPFRGHFRVTTRDTELGGVPLPAGSRLMLAWGAVNRDPDAFSDPDRLDLHRPAIRSHTAFGRGIHFCVGAHLARLETRLAVKALLATGPFHRTAPAEYVPSLLVRRLTRLDLAFPSPGGPCGMAVRSYDNAVSLWRSEPWTTLIYSPPDGSAPWSWPTASCCVRWECFSATKTAVSATARWPSTRRERGAAPDCSWSGPRVWPTRAGPITCGCSPSRTTATCPACGG